MRIPTPGDIGVNDTLTILFDTGTDMSRSVVIPNTIPDQVAALEANKPWRLAAVMDGPRTVLRWVR